MSAIADKQAEIDADDKRTPVEKAEAFCEWLRFHQVTGSLLTDAEARLETLRRNA